MKKLYFIIPTILAVIFLYFYLSERKAIEANVAADRARQAQEAETRKQEELAMQDRARKEAVIQAEARAKEREQKQRIEDAQKEAIQTANSDREKAFQERERLYKQSLKSRDDLTAAREQLRRAREQVKLQQAQVDYIKNSIKDVTAKKSIYQDAADKLEIFERAAAAEAARLAATTKKS